MPRPARFSDNRKTGTAPEPRRHRHTDYSRDVAVGNEDDLEAILEKAGAPLLLILDQVTDPHNLGACLRTANAAGVAAVIAPRDRSATLTETVRHIACGAAELTPFIQVTNLARTMERLKERGVWITGTADEASKSLYEIDFRGPSAIVAGAEGPGMRRLTSEKCDFLVKIPMLGGVPCLNVSVAAGVCLFEAVRQRVSPPGAAGAAGSGGR
jgi:23S rRNA (guanosine2251-2'-O)-methyltransferase